MSLIWNVTDGRICLSSMKRIDLSEFFSLAFFSVELYSTLLLLGHPLKLSFVISLNHGYVFLTGAWRTNKLAFVEDIYKIFLCNIDTYIHHTFTNHWINIKSIALMLAYGKYSMHIFKFKIAYYIWTYFSTSIISYHTFNVLY